MNKGISNTNESTKAPRFEGEVIILAGGPGNQLHDAAPGLPECMTPVNGQPFLTYVIRYLLSEGVKRFIFLLGYKHEMIEEFLYNQFPTIDFENFIEEESSDTGEAILSACKKTRSKNVLVVNGNSLFKVDLKAISSFHEKQDPVCTLVLKPIEDFDRYTAIEIDNNNVIVGFKEKAFFSSGLIDGGLYVLDVEKFLSRAFPQKFSFEKDFLEKEYRDGIIHGIIKDEYFIDIGNPGNLQKAQAELKYHPPDLKTIDKNWTLFIDRDGVINHEKQADYIRNWREFRFYDGAKEALKILSGKFGKIIVVSNQRGVGKELMTEEDLNHIHREMLAEIEHAGGRVDKIYYCTSTDTRHPDRKPNPGMALQAKNEFSSIDLSKSIMVGNNSSDMLFGRNAGLYTVFVKTTKPDMILPNPDIDLVFHSLIDFAKAL